jgi:hypothetical protein
VKPIQDITPITQCLTGDGIPVIMATLFLLANYPKGGIL